MFNFRRWRATELFWSWCVYWLVLGLVTLGPPLRAAWRVTRPGTGHGNIAAALGDGVFRLTVAQTAPAAETLWNGSIPILPAILWVAVPPLLLWAGWLMTRPKGGLAAGDRTDSTLFGRPAAEPFRRAEGDVEPARRDDRAR